MFNKSTAEIIGGIESPEDFGLGTFNLSIIISSLMLQGILIKINLFCRATEACEIYKWLHKVI